MDVAGPEPGVIDSAVDWYVRTMSGDANLAIWQAYETWLQADPAHRQAARMVDELLVRIPPWETIRLI